MSESLFSGPELKDFLWARMLGIKDSIESIPENQFISTGDSEILAHLISRHEVIPLEIYESNARANRREIKIRREDFGRVILIDGLSLDVSIPYAGEAALWHQKPNPWREPFPTGTVIPESDSHGRLEISVCAPVGEGEDIFNRLLERALDGIRFYLASHRKHIATFNANIPAKAVEFIAERRQRLAAIGRILETFKIPLRRRDGVPDVSMIPIRRKLVRPLPPAPDSPQTFGIRDEDYEHILSVIRHEGRTYEITPSTYDTHDEGELRDIILAHLNGHYFGDATSETFRNRGKTDVVIEFKDRAAFVAECKIWQGKRQLHDAIDQLLRYLTWRDCKGAIVLFNKHVAAFSQIQQKVASIIESHACFVDVLACKEAGEWRYRFNLAEDKDHCVIIHVFLFNLHVHGKQRPSRKQGRSGRAPRKD